MGEWAAPVCPGASSAGDASTATADGRDGGIGGGAGSAAGSTPSGPAAPAAAAAAAPPAAAAQPPSDGTAAQPGQSGPDAKPETAGGAATPTPAPQPPPTTTSTTTRRRVRASALAAALACDACAGVLIDPVTATACAHTFCRACINGWLDGGGRACPGCVLDERKGVGVSADTSNQPRKRGRPRTAGALPGTWGLPLATPESAGLGAKPYESGRLKADPTLAAIVATVFPHRGGGTGSSSDGGDGPTPATLAEMERRYGLARVEGAKEAGGRAA